MLLTPNETRSRLTQGIDTTAIANNPIGLLEDTLVKVIAAAPLEKRLHIALHKGHISGLTIHEQVAAAVTAGEFTEKEAEQLLHLLLDQK